MEVLIAEDDNFFKHALEKNLQKWGYTVSSVNSGLQAWNILEKNNAPKLIILDWMMPEMEGPEVCRKFRNKFPVSPAYFILLTAKNEMKDIVEGLNSGADDYVGCSISNYYDGTVHKIHVLVD